jgi:hypothetical protein
MSDLPEKYLKYVRGPYGPVLFSSADNEPIGWGYRRATFHVDEELFREIGRACDGTWIYTPPGSINGTWVLVTKWLTPEEAVAKYGPVTKLKQGPQGGFKSVTYGNTLFLHPRLKPDGIDVDKSVIEREPPKPRAKRAS